MVSDKTIKSTKNGSIMAFITLEDLLGSVEVIIFPKDYEKYKSYLTEERKILIKGRTTVEEDKPAKLICQKVVPFDEVPRELWLQFENREAYQAEEQKLFTGLADYDGRDTVMIYLRTEKKRKQLPNSRSGMIDKELLERLYEAYGEDNVKVVEKSIEKSL